MSFAVVDCGACTGVARSRSQRRMPVFWFPDSGDGAWLLCCSLATQLCLWVLQRGVSRANMCQRSPHSGGIYVDTGAWFRSG